MTIGQTITIAPAFDLTGEERDNLGMCSGRIVGIFGEDIEVELFGPVDLDGRKVSEVFVNFRRVRLG